MLKANTLATLNEISDIIIHRAVSAAGVPFHLQTGTVPGNWDNDRKHIDSKCCWLAAHENMIRKRKLNTRILPYATNPTHSSLGM